MLERKVLFEHAQKGIHLFENDIYALNRFMALNPEVGSEEFESSKKIVEVLRNNAIDVEYPFGGLDTSFLGKINPEKKKRAAILVEYDALRGLGHACGHCASGAASVLATLMLNEIASELDFGIDIIGTPDEEISGCKEDLAQQGVFDNHDFAIMVHMGDANYTTVNFIALDGLGFIWRGTPAHAAANPELGKNAMNAARLFLDATDMMRQHLIQEARIHGYIKKAGSASNIVPDFAEIEFITRAPKRAYLNYITEWVKDCAQAAAVATKTEVEMFPVGNPFHELYVGEYAKTVIEECFDDIGESVITDVVGMTGSSDIGNVDRVCPAFHPIIGVGNAKCHTKEFAEIMLDDSINKAIVKSAELIVDFILKLYCDEDILNKIKKEHAEYRKENS